jgi:sterol desaturase/sphingolipid hydroxylase (fatty acid hydroxylase superfamily)
VDALVLGAALALVVVAERFPLLRFERAPLLRPFVGTDLTYLATGAILLSKAMQHLVEPWAGAFRGIHTTIAHMPFAATVAVAIILHDLGGYVSHVALHRIGALWNLHKVHHSSRTLDWLATFRAHPIEHAIRHFASPVLLILLGFPIQVVAIASVTMAIWAAVVHANLQASWRWLEPVLITPRLHRMHHVPATSTSNLGVLFSFWDRILGTLDRNASAQLAPTGVPGAIETYPQTWPRQFVAPISPGF